MTGPATGGLRILVTGSVAANPTQGGAVWAVLQYVMGLRRLGHDVCFVEPLPESAIRPGRSAFESSTNVERFLAIAEGFGLQGRAAVLSNDTRLTAGMPLEKVRSFARDADVLIDISGLLGDDELARSIPVRVYLDLDPGFTQLWHAVEGVDMGFDAHTHHVTIGLSVGRDGCPVPTCGIDWLTTVQPIVLEHWPAVPAGADGAYTTVANWRSYGTIEHQGTLYGQKAHAWRRLMDLPMRCPERFEVALDIHPEEVDDLDVLTRRGWFLVDPVERVGTPERYRRFIQESKAEIGIVKSGYVESRCGWFSDRSVCYLASGRPVVAQDTGFGDHLPTGEGLLGFSTPDEALSAMEEVDADYARHSRAARTLAEDHFESDSVLTTLLRRVGVGP